MRVKVNGLVLKSGGHLRKDYPLLNYQGCKARRKFVGCDFCFNQNKRCVASPSDYGKVACARLDVPGCAQRLTG